VVQTARRCPRLPATAGVAEGPDYLGVLTCAGNGTIDGGRKMTWFRPTGPPPTEGTYRASAMAAGKQVLVWSVISPAQEALS
jgi:hypothetical protein